MQLAHPFPGNFHHVMPVAAVCDRRSKCASQLHQRLIHPIRWAFPAILLAATAMAQEAANYRFDAKGAHQPEGFPEPVPMILAIAGKPVTLHFSGLPADWQPDVHIHRITDTRRIALPSVEAEHTEDSWKITWTPAETRSPAQYEIRLDGEPKRVVRLETRDPKRLAATRKSFANADWTAQGLTTDEHAALAALATLDIKIQTGKSATATLEIRPRKGDAARRRIVWDEENPAMLVWRPGPATGDLEARAPRWWISPAALATDHGLIRFLDLFSEPPLNP